ncbi:MAG: DEAD/DEAH box helicase [Flavobacterium psychrophilum]|nr:MAG: DEAD/DEAH box helicase [Flavobacterium psychrophilum]
MKHTDTSEKGFQHLIKSVLMANGFTELLSNEFDREFCLNKDTLMSFIQTTQPDNFKYIQQKGERTFLVRLDKRIQEKGIIETLKKGVTYFDKTIDLFYPQPNSTYNTRDQVRYESNIFSVTEELIYTYNNKNRLDLAIFINGLPIITLELKNAFTYQAVENGIRQYMYDRSPKDKIFNLGRCMVHFAADTTQVYMTSELAEKKTIFFPFNKGLNDGKPYAPFGAGNPVNAHGQKSSYLYEDVLTKASLANIIEKFAMLIEVTDPETGKTKRVQTFPRYHQLKVVTEILKDCKNTGIGSRYLIQHSAGSGKSNSIAWLAHQLIGLYDKTNTIPLFDSVIVVTDRTVLDEQIRENIKRFAQVKKIVEAITGEAKHIKELDPSEESFSKTTHMRLALANNKKIITSTVQTFPFVLNVIQDMSAKKVAIIIDEAHSSQSGYAAASLNAVFSDKQIEELPKDDEGNISTEDLVNFLIESKRMLPNASYFAFTATPKNKTLETFGAPNPYKDEHGEQHIRYLPFHTYSMKQAIEEEFILDVLENYSTWQSFYKVKMEEGSPSEQEFDTLKANKKIRSYVEGHELAIIEKAKIMIDHFNNHVRKRIQNKAKAMVVCKSIESAMKYKDAFDSHLQEINSSFKAIVAFSGKKKHYKTGEELTEEKMNKFPDNLNDIPKQFKKDEYKFLIVAEKYQTGFDEPLLHTMYVDKQLSDIQAVQTLSRLNRAYKPHKKDTFVLDFYNSVDEIREAFEPFYTTTILSRETDQNRLNDLQEELDERHIYDRDQVEGFFKKYYASADRRELDAIIEGVVRNFNEELIQDQQIEFKSNAKSFVRAYGYLAKIMDSSYPYWEMLWLFLKHLIPHLKVEDDSPDENILDVIDMESYRISKQGSERITLHDDGREIDPIPVDIGGGRMESRFDTLANIVTSFNQRFGNIDWGAGVDSTEAEKILTETIPQKLAEDSDGLLAILNSDKSNAREESNNLVRTLMQTLMFTNTGIYKKYADDPNFRDRYQEFIFDLLWKKSRDNQSRI